MIRDLYQQGAVIGGTSAGAAIMSELMITGDEARNRKRDHEFENNLKPAMLFWPEG